MIEIEVELKRTAPKTDRKEPAPKVSPEVSAQAVLRSLASAVEAAARKHANHTSKPGPEIRAAEKRTPQTLPKREAPAVQVSRSANQEPLRQKPSAEPQRRAEPVKVKPEQRGRLEVIRGGAEQKTESSSSPHRVVQAARPETKVQPGIKPEREIRAEIRRAKEPRDEARNAGKSSAAGGEPAGKTQLESLRQEGIRREPETRVIEERKAAAEIKPEKKEEVQADSAKKVVPFERFASKAESPAVPGREIVRAEPQPAAQRDTAMKRSEERAAEAGARSVFESRIFESQAAAKEKEREEEFEDFFSRRKKRLRAAVRKAQRKKALERQRRRLAKLKKKKNGKSVRAGRSLLKRPGK